MSNTVALYGFGGSGGGGGLNFKVVGGTTQPTNPTENTIWVNTSVSITDWVFSAAEPTAQKEGMVWISTGTASGREFNALKKNGIQVYPLAAKQYIGGAWVDVTAKSYQDGAWGDWIPKGALYYKGDECENNGGKWVNKPWAVNSNGYNGVSCTDIKRTDEDITMTLVHAGAGKSTTLIKENLLDLTDYSTLTFEYVASGNKYITFFAAPSGSTYYSSGATMWGTMSGAEKVATIDVSALTGKYVVGVGVAQSDDGQTSVVTLKEVILS